MAFKIGDGFPKINMRKCVEAFVSDVDIEAAKIPFGAIALDLISGKQLVLRHGSSLSRPCAIEDGIDLINRRSNR